MLKGIVDKKPALVMKIAGVLTRSPSIFFLFVALAIMGPLLRPGYLLALDSSIALNWDSTGYFLGLGERLGGVLAATANSAPITLVLKIIGWVVPMWLVEKVWLLALFTAGGVGMARMPGLRGPGRYYAGVAYMVNPFSYIRFVEGQWGVLGSYLLFPLAIVAFLQALDSGKLRQVAIATLLTTLVGIVQLHGLLLLLLIFAVLLLIKMIVETRQCDFKSLLSTVAQIGGLLVLLNLYWLLPASVAGSSVLERLDPREFALFAPISSSGLGIPFDVISLYAFWKPGYLHVKDLFPFWWVAFLGVFLLASYGAWSGLSRSHHRGVVVAILLLAVMGAVLTLGASSSWTGTMIETLFSWFTPFRAFRDTGKFAALIALAYAYLGGLGLHAMLTDLAPAALAQVRGPRKRWLPTGHLSAGLAISFPVLLALPIFGTHGQLGPVHYPAEWGQVREALQQDDSNFNTLFFPWHMYLALDWVPNRENVVANPASRFFQGPIVSGDNIELPTLYSQSVNPMSLYIEFLLEHRDSFQNFGGLIAPLNVKYVVLAHEADFTSYEFLHHQRDLEVIVATERMTLFRNAHPTAPVYLTSEIALISDWEELLERSQYEDLTKRLYVLTSSTAFPSNFSKTDSSQVAPLDVRKRSQLRYDVQGGGKGFLVLTLPQRVNPKGWRLNGDESNFSNMNISPAFTYLGVGQVTYGQFSLVYLPALIVSLGTLAAMLVVVTGLPAFFRQPSFRSRTHSK